MSEVILQHILTTLEAVKASQQSLQSSHQTLQAQVAASKADLEAKFASSDDIPSWALYVSKAGIRQDTRRPPRILYPKCHF